MLRLRVRGDGVRELRTEDQLYEIPHDHQIAAEPLFTQAARRAWFVDPRFMYASNRDMDYADAVVWLAAARDLDAIGFYCPKVTELLVQAGEILRAIARSSVSPRAIDAIEDELEQKAHPAAMPSVGPEFADDVWLDGLACEDAVCLPVAEEKWFTRFKAIKAHLKLDEVK